VVGGESGAKSFDGARMLVGERRTEGFQGAGVVGGEGVEGDGMLL
jgi:hypothetical protein